MSGLNAGDSQIGQQCVRALGRFLTAAGEAAGDPAASAFETSLAAGCSGLLPVLATTGSRNTPYSRPQLMQS